jgi:hypothetical protein
MVQPFWRDRLVQHLREIFFHVAKPHLRLQKTHKKEDRPITSMLLPGTQHSLIVSHYLAGERFWWYQAQNYLIPITK